MKIGYFRFVPITRSNPYPMSTLRVGTAAMRSTVQNYGVFCLAGKLLSESYCKTLTKVVAS